MSSKSQTGAKSASATLGSKLDSSLRARMHLRCSVMLSMLALVHGRGEHYSDSQLGPEMLAAQDHKDALIDIPAEDLKQMILNLLEESQDQ